MREKKKKKKESRKSQRHSASSPVEEDCDSQRKTTSSRKRRASSPLSHDGDTFEEPRKRRGRPPRAPSSASTTLNTLHNSSARRSKRRTFAVDPHKPLLLIRPHENLQERFDLGDKELSELLDILNEDPSDDPFAVRFDDLSSGPVTPSAAQVVFTPRVSTAVPNEKSSNEALDNKTNGLHSTPTAFNFGEQGLSGRRSGSRQSVKSNGLRAQSPQADTVKRSGSAPLKHKKKPFAPPDFKKVRRGSKYVEYDMDSGDEEFLAVTLPDSLRNNRRSSGTKKLCPNCKSHANKKVKPGKLVVEAGVERCTTKSCVNYNIRPQSDVITPEIFEKMISILERELEVAKLFLKERIRADLQGLVTKNLIEDGYSSLVHVNQYLNPSSDSSTGKAKTSAHSQRARALASLEKAFEHSRGEEACLSRKASTSSIVTAAVAAASAAASGDTTAPGSMGDILATLSCPAPLAVLLSTVPRNSPRGTAQTTTEAAAVFTSTLSRSASQNSIASSSSLAEDVQQFRMLNGKKESCGNSSPRSGCSSPRNSPRNEDIQTNSQFFTSEHLRELVPEDRVVLVLARVLSFNHASDEPNGTKHPPSTTSRVRGHAANGDHDLDPALGLILGEIYNYWVEKRSCHLDSLLRCYHNFMMDEWHQAPSMPPLPEDFNIEELKKGHMELHRLRFDLDRARLIVDRVRRRERIKKDLIKLSSDNFDKVLNIIRQTQEGSRSPVTTVKTKGLRRGSKKEIDRCKVVSKLPSMLEKRLFSLHAEDDDNFLPTQYVDESADDAEDNDKDSESEATENQVMRNDNSSAPPGKKITAGKRDVMVVPTGQPLETSTGSRRVSSGEGPSLRRRSYILPGRRISRASDEVNTKAVECSSSTSSNDLGIENNLETSSVSSTTTSISTGIRVPNGNRNSRGSLDPSAKLTNNFSKSITMVSIPKLKKGVSDHNSMRTLSSSPSILSDNQKWSSLAVRSAMKKAVVVPEVLTSHKRKLRNVPARLVKPPASRTPVKRVAKKVLSVSSEDSSSSSSSSSDSEEDSEDEESSSEESEEEQRLLQSMPVGRYVEAPGLASESDSDSSDEEESEEESEEERGALRSSRRLAGGAPARGGPGRSNVQERRQQAPIRPVARKSQANSRNTRQYNRKRSAEESSGSESDSSEESDSDNGSDNETQSGSGDSNGEHSDSEVASSTQGSHSDDNSDSEDILEPEVKVASGRARPRRLAKATPSTRQTTATASSPSSQPSSEASAGGFGSRAVKRGTYSPALCSLSGLARPFMSGGGFSFCFS